MMDAPAAAIAGLLAGLGLIVAIGAQNAFVLRQGLRREHVGLVVAICMTADASLIALGTLGIGAIVEAASWVPVALRWYGEQLVGSVRAERRLWKHGDFPRPIP